MLLLWCLCFDSVVNAPVSSVENQTEINRFTAARRICAAFAAADLSTVPLEGADVPATIGALDAGGLDTGVAGVGADPNLCPSPLNVALLDVQPMTLYPDQQLCESLSYILAILRLSMAVRSYPSPTNICPLLKQLSALLVNADLKGEQNSHQQSQGRMPSLLAATWTLAHLQKCILQQILCT